MQQVIAGSACVVSFDLVVDGNFVSPDVGSASYTLRDNAGAAVGAQTGIAIVTAVDQTSINVPIALTYNSKTLDTERRTVVLSFLVGGRSYQLAQSYLLTDWLPFTATPADVRSYIGASVAELPDDAVDMVACYYEIANSITRAVFDAALAAGGRQAIVSNKAIVYQAAIFAVPGLRLRVNMTEKADAVSFSRFKDVNWGTFLNETNALLSQAIAAATATGVTVPTFLTTNSPTDPVTGA
jgi:hypothetical protein